MIYRKFGNTGVALPLVGQGTWKMGESRERAKEEIQTLRLGIDLGMTHIDTAEMYGNGSTEELVGRAIEGVREKVFLASKVLPSNASYQGTIRACEGSLRRLRTDYLDLYLLHWWSRHPVEETMRAMEELARLGRIRFFGVSNFDIGQLGQAERAITRGSIACNQVCYHLKARGIEYSLIGYCRSRGIPLVGYSPFGSGDFPSPGSRAGRALAEIGKRHGKSARQVALNFLTREEGLFSIPKAGRAEHVRENSSAVGWELSEDDIEIINGFFPRPDRDTSLEMI
ncbi:MAG: aldo/keto reductase [Acidobacteria bacterium]|nr:aldo/keto reductase [Acidobacteriota bacterium]